MYQIGINLWRTMIRGANQLYKLGFVNGINGRITQTVYMYCVSAELLNSILCETADEFPVIYLVWKVFSRFLKKCSVH